MPYAGDNFGRYRLDAVLGEGGMGTVFRAFDTVLHRPVALKVVKADSSTGPQSSDANLRLVREARAAAALRHPHVVSIFDVGEIDGVAFISMELVEGRSLRTIWAGANEDWCEHVRWLLGVAKALEAAHGIGLVHRDIKPDNILVATDGTAKVLDFGIARAVASIAVADARTADAALGTLTHPGMLVGTPMYMAPEQLQGASASFATDQFAWGTVAYELLSGVTPWAPARSAMEIFSAILLREPQDLRRRVPEIPDDLAACVHRCMTKSPEARHAGMGDVVALLEGYCSSSLRTSARLRASSGALVAAAPSPAAWPRKRTAALFVALGCCAVAALALSLTRLRRHDERPAVSVAAPTSSGPTPITSAPHTPSKVSAAEAAYVGALQAYRDGIYSDAVAGMNEALRLDPSMACASLRLAVWVTLGDAPAARRLFAEARKFRSTLTPRDLDMLDALAPMFDAEVFDTQATLQRFTELQGRWPGDVEIPLYTGILASVNSPQDAIPHMQRSVGLDPAFAEAWAALGISKALSGFDGKPDLDTCLTISPGANECMALIIWLEKEFGGCSTVETLARQQVLRAPRETQPLADLAAAQFALGRPIESVRETLKRKLSAEHRQNNLLGTPSAEVIASYDAINLAAVTGDFVTAERQARALEEATESAPDEVSHAIITRRLVEVLIETGRVTEAAEAGDRYMRRRHGWSTDPSQDDWAVERDIRPTLDAVALRAHKISATEFRARRTAWIDGWKARLSPFYRKWLWTHGYARTAETREEAIEALAAVAEFAPIPVLRFATLSDADFGRVYLLAGQPREAIAPLERATRSCLALPMPFIHTRAHYFLGLAREAMGDVPGACAAYAVVEHRWGAARPKSTTATLSAKRVEALHCPKP